MSVVTLREVTDEDVEKFYEHQADPVASEMAAFPSRDLAAHRAHWTKIRSDPDCITKTIVCDGVAAGNIGSWIQDGHREIGYWIGRAHWGKGIATEAIRLLTSSLDERPVYAYVVKHNIGSIRALEKVGFVPDGEEGNQNIYVLGDVPETA